MPVIKDDKFVINTAPVDAVGGAKPEPEERPIVRVMDTEAKTGWGQSFDQSKGDPLPTGAGNMKAAITAESTVGHVATMGMKSCKDCVHWNPGRWKKTLNKWKNSTDPFEIAELEMARGMSTTGNIMLSARGEFAKIDSNLEKSFGLCEAYTRYFKEELKMLDGYVTWTHPDSQCPGTTKPNKLNPKGTVLPELFKAKKNSFWGKIRENLLFTAWRK